MATTRELPTGTVTFLFSDIEGSTRLVQELGDGYHRALEDHSRTFREIIAREGGHDVGTEGDSFFVVFPSARGAVSAAVSLQRALAGRAASAGPALRVRVGLHTAEAVLGGDNYVGLEVHRAARISGAGHGGQILLSASTRSVVGDRLPDGLSIRDLGDHRLRDLTRPERLYQVVAADLPGEFPALRTLDNRPNNLPLSLTSFIGRAAELEEVKRLLDQTRLLTLTGPGGTGKTRLSLQLAAAASDQFPHGVFFVTLAPIFDPALVPSTIAQTLGLYEVTGGPGSPQERLAEYLRDRELLLVLDNFEQVLSAAPVVTDLLRASPGLKVVVTSRAVLHVTGEWEYPVPPLGLPDPRHLPGLPVLSQFEAVALFIERAAAVKPGFQVTNENAPAVAEICARLDGLPLAIELAAARVRLLSPQAILARLGSRLALAIGGARDVPERQRTLRQAIDWSHDLLDPAERKLFARLAAFVGGAGLEEIETVCGPAADLGMDVLEAVGSLKEKSLVTTIGEDWGEPRFSMLETIREYAAERLEESGEAEEIRRRHAEVFLALVELAEPKLTGRERMPWLDRLEREHDNLRAALRWTSEQGDHDRALTMAGKLWRFWQQRGMIEEGRLRVGDAMARAGGEADPRARLKALEAAGSLAYWQADIDGQTAFYQEALALARRIGDEASIANALYNASFPLIYTERLEEARRHLEESLALYERLGDRLGVARVEWGLGDVFFVERRFEEAEPFLQRSLAGFRQGGDVTMEGWALFLLGSGSRAQGDPAEADARLKEALRLFAEARDVPGVLFVLDSLGEIAAEAGDEDRGSRLRGAAEALKVSSGAALIETSRKYSGVTSDEERVTIEQGSAGFAEGHRMTLDQAVAYALDDATQGSP
ncbi:MAG: tetratricopeptide repeat protein [Actinobacteria bacterium]|nr:tetratricopeptide repeat protein [Actinomycetota bacterium]